jgi:hypothetical protein
MAASRAVPRHGDRFTASASSPGTYTNTATSPGNGTIGTIPITFTAAPAGGGGTRAQFVKMLVVTDQLAPSTAATPCLDAAPGDWFAPYVAAAYDAGLVEGVSPTSFAPKAAITREQMALLLARALKLTGTTSLSFTDRSQIDAWALSGVQAAVEAGYLSGFPDGSFQPLATTTRAQAAKTLSLIIANEAPGTAAPAGATSISLSPSPVAPAGGTLTAGQVVTVTLTAKNAAGQAVPNATIYLGFQAAAGGGAASVGTTVLSATTQAFTTDASGEVTITYRAPNIPPQTGEDTLTASTGPAGTGVSAMDSCTFSH